MSEREVITVLATTQPERAAKAGDVEPAVRGFGVPHRASVAALNWFSAFQGWIVVSRLQSGLPA
jgi:hypothetical protein